MKVFIDTSYFVARVMERDQWHRMAIRAAAPGLTYYTSSLVINETVSLLQARGMFSTALTFLERTRWNEAIRTIHPDPVVQEEAWDLFGKWGGSGANAIDCVSFAMMNRAGIRKAFTFDQHFRMAGFETLNQ